MDKTFMEAMDFRHACKEFDDTKKISDEDMSFILKSGIKSPSSFGMEPWKFLVITNEELKAKIRPFCWDQVQITSCSHLVIVLAAIDSVKVESGLVRTKLGRKGFPDDKLEFYVGIYGSHLKDVLSSDDNIYSWTARQTYIAAGNMMTGAASKGIDSCPIEGFEKENLEKVLELDTSKFQVSCVLPFGYRLNEQSPQVREPFENIVEFIK
ncbi:NAD(P)H-dependent oxidoreductase [Poseidonibacter lekithochrous]|uniref:NAD(P)H-dependent oxidoreductase n=1 Tax=Poseidonibacter TaxID=2321187 RepID=UPI001C08B6A0|nr:MULTISPECIES: NAD(P)H-dependent oxidoreductase [Poseidonibacter]MBU3014939.1 NAD(P)H-dependent oxidoreductase [Poseidonibacter lekithochrous]MDO6828237.1 NAD(P)H-dependent oxidoreductase [Poseidonibacter sp. 1_MG-2023]